ncbi:MAG: bifunctional folylpolyglutamate synthase/dihydrofolate synthase [Clostridiales bacterium]|nr:bifunctional folylpolyglutamate synthase/dihydrofolate synthase [Clostridiales bacterium]MDO5141140.1 folylpolyglutamate synthase/dihydrofolate synthase family protein [Eubacteriales bacterium]
MTLQEAIDYINDFTWSTSRPGLERTEELLRRVGDPQKRLKFVHVAGTNGKGSTCAMLECILRNAGYRTGFYPSPFIEDFRERIQVNGEYISEEALTRITETVSREADAMEDHPSQFELITAIGMLYFEQTHCDIVVMEVGMGGSLDSTNVIDPPEAAVITNIGLDHTEYLGNTIEEIAAAKAGIIKAGTRAVCYAEVPSVLEVLKNDCAKKNVPLRIAGECTELEHDLDGQRFVYKGEEYRLSLLGTHQLNNAAVVLETIETLKERGYSISREAVLKGLEEVRWPARFEVLSKEPLFVLDGGHNPQCAEALVSSIREYIAEPEKGEKVTFLIGMLADKDYRSTLELIRPFGGCYVCITPDSPRALAGSELAAVIEDMYEQDGEMIPVTFRDNVGDAITAAVETGLPVVAFGSLYSAGEIRRTFRNSRWA